MQLATKTTYSIEQLLADWRWLLPDDVELVVITKMGDAFVRRLSDGAILWLNVTEGSVDQVSASLDKFQAAIAESQNIEKWFLPDIVQGQSALGVNPNLNECLSFKVPPILGGQVDADNIEVTDIAVHFSVAGQIHKHTKDLPHEAKIDRIEIGEPPQKKPFWRFW